MPKPCSPWSSRKPRRARKSRSQHSQLRPHRCSRQSQSRLICGTDLHIYEWDQWASAASIPRSSPDTNSAARSSPSAMNHQRQGRRFRFAEMHVACGKCLQCRTGEAHILPEREDHRRRYQRSFRRVLVIPNRISGSSTPPSAGYASILDPLGNAVHTVLAGEIAAKPWPSPAAAPSACSRCSRASRRRNHHLRHRSQRTPPQAGNKNERRLRPRPLQRRRARHRRRKNGRPRRRRDLEMAGQPDAIRLASTSSAAASISLLGLTSKPIPLNFSEDIISKAITIQGINGRRMYQTWYQMTVF